MAVGRRKKLVQILGYAVSAICLAAIAFRVDWHTFVIHVRQAQALPIAIATALLTVTYFLFALRWRLLLSFEPKPSLIQVGSFLMLGYLGNLMLPMRAGDAARVLLIRNAYGRGATRALSSILLERLLDVLTVLLFGAAVAFIATLPGAILSALVLTAVLAGLVIPILIFIAVRPSHAISALQVVMRPFSPRIAHALVDEVHDFATALQIIVPDRGSIQRVVGIVTSTVLGWTSYGAAMIACTAAFDVHPAVAAGLLIMVVTCLGSAIPSSPGSLGVYHGLAVLALSVWEVNFDLALSVATVSHAVVIGVQLVLGLLALAVVGRNKSVFKVVRASTHNE